jgi:flagellar basal body-associated protein FliL
MAEKPTSSPSPSPAKPAASATADEMAHAEKLMGGGAPQGAEEAGAKSHGAKPAPAKKKKGGKGKSGPSLMARAAQGIKSFKSQFAEIFRGLWSPDRPTRRMSLFFFFTLAALVSLGILTAQRSVKLRHEREAQVASAKEEAIERSTEAALLGRTETPGEKPSSVSMLNIGHFTIELKTVAGQPKAKGFMNMAEIELVLECDSQDTRSFIEENLVQARSQITDIFLSMDRDELLSREGKRKLKKRLMERLNGWIPRGKVQSVFFSMLVVA